MAATTTTSRSESRRWVVWALLLLLLPALLAACSSCGEGSKGPEPSATAAVVTPVSAPAGLLAELYVEKPGSTWKSLRDLVGGPTRLLPVGFQMLAATLLGLPPDAAGLIDDLPVYGVLVLDEEGVVRVVIGVHVRSGREVIASLTTGSKARFHAHPDKSSGVTVLDPVPGKASREVALGVVGHYLLAAEDSAVVKSAGPFVARTLPTRQPPQGSIVAVADHEALAGPIASRIEESWKTYQKKLAQRSHEIQARRGRPADFADPAVALMGANSAVGSLVMVMKSAERLTFVIEPLAGRLEAHAELTPGKSGAAAELIDGMSVGSLDSLMKLPSGTALALASHTNEKSRQSSIDTMQAALEKLFGKRLAAPDRKKLEQILSELAKGRGDDAAIGVAVGAQGGVLLRSSVADAKAFQSGARGLFELLRVPAIAQPLEQLIGRMSVRLSKTHVKGIDGNVERAEVTIQPGHGKHRGISIKTGSKPIDFLWTVRDGVALGAAAHDPAPGLARLVRAAHRDPSSLAGEAAVARAVQRFGHDASFALFVDPRALGGGAAARTSSPVVLGIGRSHGRAWVKAEASQAAIQAVLRFTEMRR